MRLLVFGATGLVGRHVVEQAIGHPSVTHVIAPVRRRPDEPVAGAHYEVVDFADLSPQAAWWQADAVVIALGTTIARAGNQAAFEAIDLDLVVTVASMARGAGVRRAAVVSSVGADATANNFYLMVKGKMEQAVRALEFPQLAIVRPSLLIGTRDERRTAESLGLFAARLFRRLIPARYRPVSATSVAACLLREVASDRAEFTIIESEEIEVRDDET